MKGIFSKAGREILDQFAWSNVLLAFDYDGTLAPIVEDPEQSGMRARTRDLLKEAAMLYPIIVISGRARRDAVSRLKGLGLRAVIGNHGIEPRRTRKSRNSQPWVAVLGAALAAFKGVTIEDKGFTVAIHYRRSREKKRARAAALRAVAELGEVRVIGGKQVVNVLPMDAPHKGFALARERARLHCDTAIFVGDDETDEDVFALDQPGQLLSIRVGAARASAAAFCVPHQHAIDNLLQLLIDLRRKAARPSFVRG